VSKQYLKFYLCLITGKTNWEEKRYLKWKNAIFVEIMLFLVKKCFLKAENAPKQQSLPE
jgi:hypothetical protein